MTKVKITAMIDGEVVEKVTEIKLSENRKSLSNTLETLLKEAIDSRESKIVKDKL